MSTIKLIGILIHGNDQFDNGIKNAPNDGFTEHNDPKYIDNLLPRISPFSSKQCRSSTPFQN